MSDDVFDLNRWHQISTLLGAKDAQVRRWALLTVDPLPMSYDRFRHPRASTIEVLCWGVRAGILPPSRMPRL